MPGDSLARDLFPESLRGFARAAVGRVMTAEMAAAGLRGYAIAAAFLGYLTTFYWFARDNLGAWLPAEGPYSDIFNNAFPIVTPLTMSLVAAISEEVMFRLFGISLFKHLFRRVPGSTAIALVLPAAIWAFAHSNYPVFPVYLRGIELTIGGVFFGIAFLRFGLLACIVAHYVVDAVLLGLPLVASGNATYAVSGLAVMGLALVPAVLGLVARRRSGQVTDSRDEAAPPISS